MRLLPPVGGRRQCRRQKEECFLGQLDSDELAEALADLTSDFASGHLWQADILWRAALNGAAELSQRHTPTLGTKWPLHKAEPAQPGCGEANITALYTAKFGAPPPGQKVFIRSKQMLDGYEDLPHQWSGSIPAAR